MRYLTESSPTPAQLYVRRGFFELPLCQQLLVGLRQGTTQPATISSIGGLSVTDERRRKTADVALAPELRSIVENRFEAVRTDLAQHFRVSLPAFQKPQFLRYQRGDFFRPHQDSSPHSDHAPEVRFRVVSAVVFINQQSRLPAEQAYCGGELRLFRLDDDPDPCLHIVGEPGLLVAFASDVFHEVRPVTHGERFTVVTWFVDRKA